MHMEIHKNIPLKNFTTMRLGGPAKFMTECRTDEEVATICRDAKSKNVPIFIIGDGSNLIGRDEGYPGIIIRIRIPGFGVLTQDDKSATLRIGAGENWDQVVERAVDMGLSGIEAMSGIPGTAGATPIQNVGAYGQEIADTLQSLTAYDIKNDKFVTIQAADCGFSYRNSIFRSIEMGRYAVTSITLKLSKQPTEPPFYESLQKYLDDMGVKKYSPKIIRDAVMAIRQSKLPDPAVIPSCGSFFKNAIVETWQLDDLQKIDPKIPLFAMGEGKYKVPVGYLLDAAGLRGKLFHGMRIYDKNALILVNESATSYKDLISARNEITAAIYDKFSIRLEQEPLEIQ